MHTMTETSPVVRILAGVPGAESADGGAGVGRYPSSTTDVSKLLRERGMSVEFEHDRAQREYTSLHSSDVWLPILEISSQVLLSIGTGLLTNVVQDWLGKPAAEAATIHVIYRVVDSDGIAHEFSAVGPGREVMPALDVFERKQLGTNESED